MWEHQIGSRNGTAVQTWNAHAKSPPKLDRAAKVDLQQPKIDTQPEGDGGGLFCTGLMMKIVHCKS